MEPGSGIATLNDRADLRRRSLTLRQSILSCTNCDLHLHTSSPVPFRGPVPAKVAVLGMAPGKEEVRSLQPFVGPAGAELDRVFRKTKLDPSTLFYCNTINCMPMDSPGVNVNREPTPSEHSACLSLKLQQVFLSRAEYLIIVGKVALEGLRPDLKNSLGRLQGYGLHWERGMMMNNHPVPRRIQAIVTYHPSAALRHPPRYRPPLEESIERLVKGIEDSYIPVVEWCVICGKDAERFDENGAGWCEGHYERRGLDQGKLEV